jgi:hypothetical protein
MRPLKAVLATLTALGLAWLSPAPASAGGGDSRLLSPHHSAPPPARTPSVLRGGDPGIDRFERFERDRRHDHRRGHRHHRPSTVVIVAPSRCWQPGYWTHQWVPQAYAYSIWVAGHWSPDGRWIDGHYAPRVHHSGYYQPYWVEGYWTNC